MSSVKNEHVVLVDNANNVLGTAEKLSIHHADTPLHRAFSCYVFNSEKKLLVTRRASMKKVWPGFWTNSVCGHPFLNESTEDAIRRRLHYELGMTVNAIEIIEPEYRYKTPPFKNIVENEICPIYIAFTKSEPVLNPNEVGDFRWMTWNEYKHALANDTDNTYSWWSKDQLKHIEQYIDLFVSE